MKRFIHIILILLVGLVSCQKAPFLTFTGQRNLSFKDNGGTETITFSCNNAWTVSSSANWLKVSPSQGSANEGGVKVTITCEANTTYDPRTGTVTIMSEGITETISVSQDTNYGLQSEPTTFNLTNAAQNIEVEVKANVEYTITIDDAGKDWISQAGTKALSATKLTFSIAANEGYDDREGKITISQKGSASSVQPQVITVKQSQANGLFITTPEYELSNEAHDLTIEVKANIEYEVTSEVDWVKYEPSATKALTTSSFTLKVEKNESYDTRVGTVKVKGGGLEGVITITQAETLGLFVSPTEKSISEEAQEVEVEVNANVEYDIIVPEEAKEMITTVKKQGGDTKALSATKYLFGVSENTQNVGREASITFKQKDGALCGTVKISQEKADVIDFEDAKFKAYCVQNFDSNRDGEISYKEAREVTGGIFCSEKNISSLEGIQYFTSLTTLSCWGNKLTSLDVSKCTKLTYLYCDENKLTSLNVSGCSKLTTLDCRINNLTSLDASKCIELTKLDCRTNNLTSLDVSGCSKLTTLDCGTNSLTSLDISRCTELTRLQCFESNLTSLDVSKCTKLTTLNCYNNNLTSLDVSKCTELTSLGFSNNNLTSLDASKCTKLSELLCEENQITSLNVSGCSELTYLNCSNNNLTSLDVSKCTKLTGLACGRNNLTSLDVSKCTKLTTLNCYNNNLTSLDVSKCTELICLDCRNNNLTSLDVSKCTKLTYLDCRFNLNMYELWLKTGQTIRELYKDSHTVIKYKD